MAKFDWKSAVKPHSTSTLSTSKLTPTQKVIAGMDAALETFKSGAEQSSRFPIRKDGGNVIFSVKLGAAKLKLIGEDKDFAVPAKDFEMAYASIKEDVEAGAFNDQLAALSTTADERVATARATRSNKQKAPAAKK